MTATLSHLLSRLRALILVLLVAALPHGALHGALAADKGGAEAFLRGVYGHYERDTAGWSVLGPNASEVFAPRLLTLIRKDQKAAKGEVGALDYDPVCNCQDYGPFRLDTVAIEPNGADRATARVGFTNVDARVTLTLKLVLVKGRWRIDDIASPDIPSLVAHIETALAAGR